MKICKTRQLQDFKFDWEINSDCSTGDASQTLLNKDDLKLEQVVWSPSLELVTLCLDKAMSNLALHQTTSKGPFPPKAFCNLVILAWTNGKRSKKAYFVWVLCAPYCLWIQLLKMLSRALIEINKSSWCSASIFFL